MGCAPGSASDAARARGRFRRIASRCRNASPKARPSSDRGGRRGRRAGAAPRAPVLLAHVGAFPSRARVRGPGLPLEHRRRAQPKSPKRGKKIAGFQAKMCLANESSGGLGVTRPSLDERRREVLRLCKGKKWFSANSGDSHLMGAGEGAAAMKVLVADDHRLMVEGIRRALEDAEDIEVVGEASTGSQVLPLVRRLRPDVVLLDMRMPQMDGLTCLDQLRKSNPDVKVIVLSVFSDPERIQAAFKHGASGYIVKSVNPLDLPSAIRQAVDGTVFHAIGLPEVDEQSLGKASGLTDRELSILKAVAQGLSNAAIGKELWVTEQTVKFHLTNIYRKLNLANRTEAARYAYQHGLVESPLVEIA